MANATRVNPFLRPAPGFYPGGQRRRLLDQLRHLSQWSRRALLVLGPPGTGKTMLFQQLGQEMGQAVLLTQLDGRALNAELDVLIVLAEALGVDVPDSFSLDLLRPLVEAALQEQEATDQPLVVLVDDADQLDPPAMRLLLALCGKHRFRLLLFGQQALPEQVRAATRELDIAPYETALLAFSPVDSRAYLEWRCEQSGIRGGLPFTDEQVSELYRRSNGIPGELNRLAGQLLERLYDGEQTAAGLSFPATHLYLVAGLAAVLALSFLLLDRVPLTEEVVTENLPVVDPRPAERASENAANDPAVQSASELPDDGPARTAAVPAAEGEGEAAAREDEAPLELASSEPDLPPAPVAAASDPSSMAATQPIVLPESEALRSPPATSLPSRTQARNERPVAAAPDPVPAEAQTESEVVSTEPTITELEPAPAPAPSRGVEREAASVAQAPTRSTTQESQPMTLAAATDRLVAQIPGLKDGTWLLAQDQAAYTLQLVTLSSRDGLVRYLERQREPEQFAVYAREVGGRLLYVVTFGRYSTRVAAEAASRRLPAEVGKIKPWIRPFAEVHNSVTAGR